MTKNPLISVIIPIYKVEQYLNKCIDSVIRQTYKNLEIILVDDGSPDNCCIICDEYKKKDCRIKVIHKNYGGVSSARNIGLNICSGEYISFIDSDDFVDENFILDLYNNMLSNDVDIVECRFAEFEKSVDIQLIKENCRKTGMNSNNFNVFTGREMQIRLFDKDYVNHVVVWNKLYKRSIFESLRFPNGKIHEDEFVTYKAFSKASNILVLEKINYFYRIHANSIMGSKFSRKRLDVIDAYEEKKLYYKQDEEIYDLVVLKYQNLLKSLYFKAKFAEICDKDIYNIIQSKLIENFKEYRLIVSSKERIIQEFLMAYMPYLYYKIAKMKDKINEK